MIFKFSCIKYSKRFYAYFFEIINAIVGKKEKIQANSLATDPSTRHEFSLTLNPSYLFVPAKPFVH